MRIEQAWLLKGFVLAHNAPAAIVEAADAVIADLSRGTVEIAGSAEPIRVKVPVPEEPEADTDRTEPERENADVPGVPTRVPEAPATKKKRNFSPEARAAAGERMRAYQARKKADKQGSAPPSAEAAPKPFTTVPADKLVRDHSGYAGRRDPDQPLLETDWPDINNMLNVKRISVSQIASDYDVGFSTMRSFIDTHEAQEKQSPGEARALSVGGA
jgi:hypothetical protein